MPEAAIDLDTPEQLEALRRSMQPLPADEIRITPIEG
jgi:hypothetical protein